MTIDKWLTEIVEVELSGSSFDGLNSLMSYCNQNSLWYTCNVNYGTAGVDYKLTVTCTNEQAYYLIRDYKNRGGKN